MQLESIEAKRGGWRGAVLGAALGLGLAAAGGGAAQAALLVTIMQVGSNVGVGIDGSVNTAGLTLVPGDTTLNVPFLAPDGNMFQSSGDAQQWTGISGSGSLGTGGQVYGTATGSAFALVPELQSLFLPKDYVSGSQIFTTIIVPNTTLALLGITATSLVYSWGSGDTADNLTIRVDTSTAPLASAVPEPTAMALLGTGLLGLGGLTRRRGRRAA